MKKYLALALSAVMAMSFCACNGTTVQISQNSSETNMWEVRHYVDEFKEETNRKYVSAIFYGTFSNSATNGSDLMVKILVDDDPSVSFIKDPSVSFVLYEYGYNQVHFVGQNITYTIAFKLGDGSRKTFAGSIADGSDRIYITGSNYDGILSILESGEYTKAYIEIEDVLVSTYNFDVATAGFKDKFDELSGL